VDNTPTPQALPLLAQDVIIVVVFWLISKSLGTSNYPYHTIAPRLVQQQGA
jgi:hypothetical protein